MPSGVNALELYLFFFLPAWQTYILACRRISVISSRARRCKRLKGADLRQRFSKQGPADTSRGSGCPRGCHDTAEVPLARQCADICTDVTKAVAAAVLVGESRPRHQRVQVSALPRHTPGGEEREEGERGPVPPENVLDGA